MSGWILGSAAEVLAVLWPAYSSFKAIQDRNNDEYMRWMKYWVCYAVAMAAFALADLVLCWVPFYYLGKTICLLVLVFSREAADTAYTSVIHPTLAAGEPEIDAVVAELRQGVFQFLRKWASIGFQYAGNAVTNVMAILAQPAPDPHQQQPRTAATQPRRGDGAGTGDVDAVVHASDDVDVPHARHRSRTLGQL